MMGLPLVVFTPYGFLRQRRQRKQQEERTQRGMSRGDIQQRQQTLLCHDGGYPLWVLPLWFFTTTETTGTTGRTGATGDVTR